MPQVDFESPLVEIILTTLFLIGVVVLMRRAINRRYGAKMQLLSENNSLSRDSGNSEINLYDKDDELNDHGEDDQDEIEDDWSNSCLDDIESISSINDLIRVAIWYTFKGEENDAFLKKVLLFEENLNESDWAEIYHSAERGSELERVAKEKIGDAL